MNILDFLIFLAASIFTFTIPGLLLVYKINIKLIFWEKLYLSTVLGLCLSTLLAYLLLVINLSIFFFVIVFIFNLLFINLNKTKFVFPKFSKFKSKLVIFIFTFFIIGIIGQLSIIAPSGTIQDGDLVFYSAHGHDGPWHISLMEEIKKGYPLQNPIYNGERLVNYHFFSDLVPAMFSKYLGLSNLDLYFRFFPLLYSIILGASAYYLGKIITKSSWVGFWAMIFTYFAGSFGYIVTYLQNKTIGGESIFYGTQIQSSSGNPPQIISNIFVLTFFYLLVYFFNKKNYWLYFSLIVIIGTLVEFKVYASIVIFLALGISSIWMLIKDRKPYLLILTMLSGLLSALLYLPNSKSAASFLIYEPWWYIRTMVVTPSRLNLLDWELKRQTYIAEGNWKRVIQYESMSFLIFFFGNLGMRFIGLWELARTTKTFFGNYFNQIFISTIIISLILPLIFLQKGVASNTSQFLQYFILLFGILSAISITKIIKKIKFTFLKLLFSVAVIILMIPTQISLIKDFYDTPPLSKISKEELIALGFLKDQKEVVLMTPPYNGYLDLKSKVPDIWDWFDTAYVSAITSHRTYLTDSEQVDIMGYDLKSRLNVQLALFEETNPVEFSNQIKSTGATHLYFPIPQKPLVDLHKTKLVKIFSNQSVEIWKVLQ